MDIHERFDLKRVINAYDKATHLCGARVPPDIIEAVASALGEPFILDDLQDAVSRRLAPHTGAEAACAVSCAAAGITLAVAAAMTGNDPARIARLPDTTDMPDRVILQKGHAVTFGAPVTQMIRLAGAEPVEAGHANLCREKNIEQQLESGNVAAVVAVESYHTVEYNGVKLPDLAKIAHRHNVPMLVDAATQELRLTEIIDTGADLVICSAHKYFASTTAGIVAGREKLVQAVRSQIAGIGRAMKVSKEALIGILAAVETPMQTDTGTWSRHEREKIERIVHALSDVPGLTASISPDPNGCPFVRAKIHIDPKIARQTADDLRKKLQSRTPAIYVRVYNTGENRFYINATELTDDDIEPVCNAIRTCLNNTST